MADVWILKFFSHRSSKKRKSCRHPKDISTRPDYRPPNKIYSLSSFLLRIDVNDISFGTITFTAPPSIADLPSAAKYKKNIYRPTLFIFPNLDCAGFEWQKFWIMFLISLTAAGRERVINISDNCRAFQLLRVFHQNLKDFQFEYKMLTERLNTQVFSADISTS